MYVELYVGLQTVKYRRECRFQSTFVVQTRACYWDQCNIYIRQDFFNKKTGLIHCIIYCRLGLIKKGRLVKVMENKKGGFHAMKWYADSDGYENDYECRESMDDSLRAWISHQNQIHEPKLERTID